MSAAPAMSAPRARRGVWVTTVGGGRSRLRSSCARPRRCHSVDANCVVLVCAPCSGAVVAAPRGARSGSGETPLASALRSPLWSLAG